MNMDQAMLRFFLDDLGGNRVTDAAGKVLYEDEKAAFVSRERTNWAVACPAPRPDQRGELWDLLRARDKRTYMVTTSTVELEGETAQIHHIVDASLYMSLIQDITDYSAELREAKERDGLTGLYNKGKFIELKQTLFQGQDSIAVFNMDLNFLKRTNDSLGHEAGDRLLRKTAESLRRIEARNVLTFRVGGDEFLAVALHLSRENVEKLREKWEAGLAELNREEDGLPCVVACGVVYGEKGYDLEALLARADELMYADKLAKKGGRDDR